MNSNRVFLPVTLLLVLLLPACATKIYGTVQLVDANMQSIPGASPEGVVVNMINTTSALEQASHSVATNAKGKFESAKDSIKPGIYKVEVSHFGYVTETQTVDMTKPAGKKVEFKLKKIQEGKRKTISGSKSDKDKIVNPGEVNIQPPSM